MAKCLKCLGGARISTTGTDKETLRMDMGGVVLYIMPKSDGSMQVALNIESLVTSDGVFATWTGEKWLAGCGNDENNCIA
jgi:hypothetical protein